MTDFLFSLLAGPVANAPLEQRHKTKPLPNYINIAATAVVCYEQSIFNSCIIEHYLAGPFAFFWLVNAKVTKESCTIITCWTWVICLPYLFTTSSGLRLLSYGSFLALSFYAIPSWHQQAACPVRIFISLLVISTEYNLIRPSPNASYKGYRLIKRFTKRLQGNELITEPMLASLGSSIHQWFELCKVRLHSTAASRL